MRIISKFRDYYDSVQKQGMDKDIVYLREKKDILLAKNYDVNFTTIEKTAGRNSCEVRLVLLGYCGQIFKLYDVRANFFDRKSEHHTFQNHLDFQEYMMLNRLGSRYEFEENRWWPGKYSKFRDFNTLPLLEIFHEYQTPLFIISNEHFWRSKDKTTLTLGPSLNDLRFFKIKDAYTAYQDIFQFVSGVLNSRENNTVTISDKDKIRKHGFDDWSFRKLPGGKKRGKKK